MKTDGEWKSPDLWIPERDPVNVAVLGKLGEELNECGAIVSRCLIQGVAGSDPESGEANLDALQDEIADVLAMSQLAIGRFKLDAAAIASRVEYKIRHKREWHRMLREHGAQSYGNQGN